MVSSEEEELVSRARSGDTSAFEMLLAPLVGPAHRFACALLQDSQLAEDAVQEASVKAWRKLARLRPATPMRPWFLGIVANQCRDQRRGRWWSVVRVPDLMVVGEGAEEQAVRRSELRAALLRLGDAERRVLILRLYLDLPWEEVAAAAGLAEAGARSRYYRALARLRRHAGSQEVLS